MRGRTPISYSLPALRVEAGPDVVDLDLADPVGPAVRGPAQLVLQVGQLRLALLQRNNTFS